MQIFGAITATTDNTIPSLKYEAYQNILLCLAQSSLEDKGCIREEN